MPKERHLKHSLYSRILVSLTLPLFILAAIVTGFQLISSVKSLNQYFAMESRMIFIAAQKYFETVLVDPAYLNDPQKIATDFRETIPFENENVSLMVYDMFEQSALLAEQEPWNERDRQLGEKSIYQSRDHNKSHIIDLDKTQKRLTAYIPVEIPEKNSLLVVRIIYPLAGIEDALLKSRGILAGMLLVIFLTGAFIGRKLAKSIINPIRELNHATEAIMSGKLGKKVVIKTGDELEALADAFNHMSDSLKGMKENAEDTNPLTHLPGNNGIKFEVQKRLHQQQKFVLFHSDLDRFKVFNDVYGLAKGDAAIAKTAELLVDILDKEADKSNFLGHQGGDDFVIIVKPNRAKEIAETIIRRFDNEVVKSLYPKEDFERGYVEMVDRRGAAERGETNAVAKKFPLLGFSLAGVSNVKRDFASHEAVLKEAVKIKKIVKNEIKSSYMIAD